MDKATKTTPAMRIILELDAADAATVREAMARREAFVVPPLDTTSSKEAALLAEICRGWTEMLDACDRDVDRAESTADALGRIRAELDAADVQIRELTAERDDLTRRLVAQSELADSLEVDAAMYEKALCQLAVLAIRDGAHLVVNHPAEEEEV